MRGAAEIVARELAELELEGADAETLAQARLARILADLLILLTETTARGPDGRGGRWGRWWRLTLVAWLLVGARRR